jgi:hypothetical protein
MEDKSSAHAYRIQKINEIRTEIEKERDKRIVLIHKYHRGVNIVDVINTALVLTAVGFGASGIAGFSTIIAAPIAAVLGGIALAAAPLVLVGAQVNKKLALKREKHEKIKTLAEAKLSTINDLVSKALTDEYISDDEFSLIIRELVKFNKTKEEITKKINTAIEEEKKQFLINSVS